MLIYIEKVNINIYTTTVLNNWGWLIGWGGGGWGGGGVGGGGGGGWVGGGVGDVI